MAKKVTEKEKEKMWKLYQELGSYKKVAEKFHRNPDTVSRHVQAYDAAVRATTTILHSMDIQVNPA